MRRGDCGGRIVVPRAYLPGRDDDGGLSVLLLRFGRSSAGERCHERAAYAGLATSNFWVAEFPLAGRTYRTVEHAFQAAKIALADPASAERFALESGTELARGDGAAARRHRKLVLLDDTQLRHWNARSSTVMREAMHAKFSRHDHLRAVLLATRPAQLWHGTGRGRPPERIHDLEAIRAGIGERA